MKSPGELMEKRKNTDQHVLQHGEIRCEHIFIYIYKFSYLYIYIRSSTHIEYGIEMFASRGIPRIELETRYLEYFVAIYIYMHVHACETTYMPLITVNVNCYQFKIGEENRANSI